MLTPHQAEWSLDFSKFYRFLFNAQRVNLELVVADYDRIGSSDPIGKVLLGYNRKGLELKHWKEMIENPRRPIVHWHVLKDPEPGDEVRRRIEIDTTIVSR